MIAFRRRSRAEGARIGDRPPRLSALPRLSVPPRLSASQWSPTPPRTPTPTRFTGDDAGSTLLLTIFYAFLSLVLILMVTSASSLYLERKRLFTLADGAALAGAEAFELSAVAPTDDGLAVTLDSTAVDEAVEVFVETVDPGRFEDLTVERAVASDERSATVTLSSYWRPPLVSALVPEGIRLEVTTTARSIFY